MAITASDLLSAQAAYLSQQLDDITDDAGLLADHLGYANTALAHIQTSHEWTWLRRTAIIRARTEQTHLITIDSTASAGTFTLTLDDQTTGAIAYDATSDTIQTAIEAMSNVAAAGADITVTGDGPHTITFIITGAWGLIEVPTMTLTSSITGGTGTTTLVNKAGGCVILPADFATLRSDGELYYRNLSLGKIGLGSYDEFSTKWSGSKESGQPLRYIIESDNAGSRITLHPWPNATYELGIPYHKTISGLTAVTDTVHVPAWLEETTKLLAVSEAFEQVSQEAQAPCRAKAEALLLEAWQKFGSPVKDQAHMRLRIPGGGIASMAGVEARTVVEVSSV